MKFDALYKKEVCKDKLSDEFIKNLSVKMALEAEKAGKDAVIIIEEKPAAPTYSTPSRDDDSEEIKTTIITKHNNGLRFIRFAPFVATAAGMFLMFGAVINQQTKNQHEKNRNDKQIYYETNTTDKFAEVTSAVTVRNTTSSTSSAKENTQPPVATEETTTTAMTTTEAPTSTEAEKTSDLTEKTTAPQAPVQTQQSQVSTPVSTPPVTTVSTSVSTTAPTTTTSETTTTTVTSAPDTPEYPEYTVGFKVGDSYGYAGEDVYVDFEISGNDSNGFCSLLIELSYDTDSLTFNEATLTPSMKKSKYSVGYSEKSGCVLFHSSTYQNILLDNTVILHLKFTVNENAKPGVYKIDVINDDSEPRINTRYGFSDDLILIEPGVEFRSGSITVENKSESTSAPIVTETEKLTESTSYSETLPIENPSTSPAPKMKYKFKKVF